MDTNKDKPDMEDKEKSLSEKSEGSESIISSLQNPELEKAFEQMAIGLRRIAFNFAGIAEKALQVDAEYTSSFETTMNKYKNYFRENGVIFPDDTQEYFEWIALAFPDKNFAFCIEAARKAYYFRLYHEYKERMFKEKDWDEEKEYKYLQENVFNQEKRLQNPLSIKQIALKYVYEGLQITRENGDAIAKEYGHTSGEALFQRYTRYLSSANRRGQEDTRRKQQNKIDLIESIIPLLTDSAQKKALDEVSILKKVAETEYL